MWQLLLGAGIFYVVKKIIDEWGWEQDWTVDNIGDLPDKPGIYVMYKRKKVIHVGSAKKLYQRLYTHPKKWQMSSFDWYQTKTTAEARQLEKKFQEKLEYYGR